MRKRPTRSEHEAWLRAKYDPPIDPLAEASEYLAAKYTAGDSDQQIEDGLRNVAEWNTMPLYRSARALETVIDMSDDEVDFVHLVGWVANRGLSQPNVEASRAWLQEQLDLLEQVLSDYSADTIETLLDKYEEHFGFVDEPG
jgi:hypothetical protein